MENEDTPQKDISDYIKSRWEHPSKWAERLAEGLVRVEKKYHELYKEHKETKLRVDSKEVEELRKLIGPEVDKKIEEKKGVFSEFKTSIYKTFFTISGIATLAAAVVVTLGVFYVMNKTTPGQIVKSLNKVDNIEKRLENYQEKKAFNEFKQTFDDFESKSEDSQKSLEEKLTKSSEGQIAELKSSYDKQISDFKNSVDSYTKSNEELKASNDLYKKSFDEMQKTNDSNASKLKELEKRVTESEKKYDVKIKKLEKAK